MALYVSNVSDDFIRRLAHEFLEPYMTMGKLAKEYKSSASTISKILYLGVSSSILSDTTAVAVAKKAIDLADDMYKTKNRWEGALKKRKINEVQFELEHLERQLEEAKFQYDSFDDYVFDEYEIDSSSYNKERIVSNIVHLENEIDCVRNYIKSLEK